MHKYFTKVSLYTTSLLYKCKFPLYMIFTTPRASCSMKSLRAHRASILVACSPTINNYDSDIAKHLLHSNLCFLPAKTLGACSHPELVPSGNNHFRNLEHLSHHISIPPELHSTACPSCTCSCCPCLVPAFSSYSCRENE